MRVIIAQSGSSVDAKSVLRNVPVTIGLTSHPTREEVRTFPVCQYRNCVLQFRSLVRAHVLCKIASVHQVTTSVHSICTVHTSCLIVH